MLCLYIYHWLVPVFFALFPCYEAIHHNILDSVEIILYIEGQRCHLMGKAQFSHPPVFALSKGQCYFYLSIAAEGGGIGTRWGIPLHCGDICLRAVPGGMRRNYIKVTQIALLNVGFICSTRWLHIIPSFFSPAQECEVKSRGENLPRSFIFHVAVERGQLWYVVRCNEGDSLFFSSLTPFLLSLLCLPGWWWSSVHVLGTENVCHVTNSVSRMFPRLRWYHDIAVSVRERD